MPLIDRLRTSVRLRRLDLRDRLRGRREPLVPPRTLVRLDHSDFVAAGDELLGHLVDVARLRPDERILDVGCGAGRVARPLTRYLSPAGSYEGFDADRAAIGWCRRHYRGRPNFRFRVADLHHRRHNPTGGQPASEYRFPYDDASFDVVLMASVIPHLLEEEADHHLAECARVLAPGGRALLTCFCLDEDSRRRMAEGRSGLQFLDPDAHVAVVSEELPEEAVAYDSGWVRERLAAHGLAVREPILHGSWAGRDDRPSFQDLVLGERMA